MSQNNEQRHTTGQKGGGRGRGEGRRGEEEEEEKGRIGPKYQAPTTDLRRWHFVVSFLFSLGKQ